MIGLHLPNRRLEPGELDRILALGCRHYVVYVDAGQDAVYWRDVCTLIRAGQPDAHLHLRIERRGQLDAVTDAGILARVSRLFDALADTIRIRNEVNQESPGETPSTWAAYLTALAATLPADLRAKLAAPAVSPSGDWLPWLQATVAAATSAGIPIVDAHAYGSPSEVGQVLAEHRRHWRGRLLVTETNFGAGRPYSLQRWADELPEVLAVGREHRVEAVCMFIWHWSTPDVVLPTPVDVRGSPMEAAIRAAAARLRRSGGDVMSEYDSPNKGGPRAETLGVVLHSTRGGAPTAAQEFAAARAWLRTLRSQASSHAVVGPEGEVDRPVQPDLVAWHAREYNATHLGIELVQARLGDPIAPATLGAAAREVARWCVRYRIPIRWDVRRGLCEHREISSEGKTDIGPPFDRGAFLELVKREARALAPSPALDWGEVSEFGRWALGRVTNREDPRDGAAFVEHLRRLGCDWKSPSRYGWPSLA